MKEDVPEVLKKLAANRSPLNLGKAAIQFAQLTLEEKDVLYSTAKARGLLTRYEFSGVPCDGLSRTDAAGRLCEVTHQRALVLLRLEFGACARFWVKPRQLRYLDVDFYWKKANLGLVITGPLIDDPWRADPRRTRDSRDELQLEFDSPIPNIILPVRVIKTPYYSIWHQPSAFIRHMRELLAGSRQYPRLRSGM